MKKNTADEKNKKPVSKKLKGKENINNAGDHKRAHHRGSDEHAKDLKDTSTRITGESNSHRSATTKS